MSTTLFWSDSDTDSPGSEVVYFLLPEKFEVGLGKGTEFEKSGVGSVGSEFREDEEVGIGDG
jgi:hypothetical protein